MGAAGLVGCDKSAPDENLTTTTTVHETKQFQADEKQGELPVVDAILTSAPEVPPPIDRDYPAKVVIKIAEHKISVCPRLNNGSTWLKLLKLKKMAV